MDRKPVLDLPGARHAYIARLAAALSGHDCALLAYSLMSTHLHLALVRMAMPLGELFDGIHTSFAIWVRARDGGLGSVFASRFKSIPFEDELTGVLVPYIHNNEARAGLVADPAQSRWSSHRYYRGDLDPPAWLHVSDGLARCGFDDTMDGRRDFDAWTRARAGDPRLATFGRNVPTPRRELEIQHLKIPVVKARTIRRDLLLPTSVGPRAWASCLDPGWVVAVACGLFDVGDAEIRSPQRYPPLPQIRGVLLLAWRNGLRRLQVDMRLELGLSASAASHACRRASQDPQLRAMASRLAAFCAITARRVS